MPGAASGAPELRTLPAKGAPSQLRQSPSKRNGTLAPLACELWPPYRCPNPHRVCALNTGVGVLRGFLPRGLCDTGPQVVRDHRLGASSGQVSHNPKQKRILIGRGGEPATGCLLSVDNNTPRVARRLVAGRKPYGNQTHTAP